MNAAVGWQTLRWFWVLLHMRICTSMLQSCNQLKCAMYNCSGQGIITLLYYSIVYIRIDAGLLLLSGCMVCMPHTGTACRQSCCLHDTPSNFSSHTDSMAYPIQSLQSGYRYVYLASEGKMASPKVPYIFVRISVGLHVTYTLHWCVLVYIHCTLPWLL